MQRLLRDEGVRRISDVRKLGVRNRGLYLAELSILFVKTVSCGQSST